MKNNEKKNGYWVDCRFVFHGKVKVNAESKEEAIRIASEGFGLAYGSPSASDTRVLDWDFDMTPEKQISYKVAA